MRAPLLALLALAAAACGGSTPPPPRTEAPPAGPPPPSGPTRTDFHTIARKLVGRCVSGGWIERWRSTHENPDVAKPRVFLEGVENDTGQALEADYLRSVLEQRMRLSGVYDMVADPSDADFVARGRLKRLAERVGGRRVSVYTAILELESTATGKRAHQCEATVEGEMATAFELMVPRRDPSLASCPPTRVLPDKG